MTSAKDFEICSLLRKRKMEGMELLFTSYYKPLVVWADTFLRNVVCGGFGAGFLFKVV